MRRVVARAGALVTGAALGVVLRRALDRRAPGAPGAWVRTNHAGADVSLLGGLATGVAVTLVGPVLAATSRQVAAPQSVAPQATRRRSVGSRSVGRHPAGARPAGSWPAMRLALACASAGAAATAAGVLDDHGEDLEGVPTGRAKGLRGHLGALAHGQVTTGALKIAVIGAGALSAAVLLPGPRPVVARAADAALVAGCANLANLLDLRPGRALKAAGLVLAPVAVLPGADAAPPGAEGGLTGADGAVPGGTARLAAGLLGVVLAALPADLAATDMLGDTGANPLGAGVGVVLAADPSTARRTLALALVVGLTLASERVSFSQVIDSVPVLRAIDRAGRTA